MSFTRKTLVFSLSIILLLISTNHGFQPSPPILRNNPSSLFILNSIQDPSSSSSHSTSSQNNDQFIKDNFENQAYEKSTLNNELSTNDNTNVKDGKVIGPKHVLVYDTSLRGR